MKKANLREYTSRLADDELRYLATRLNNRLGGDVAEVLERTARDAGVSHWLAESDGAFQLYDRLDQLQAAVAEEVSRRR